MSIVLAKTLYGDVRGIRKDGYSVFKGIPYAKPPVGALRWRAPMEPEPWDGEYQADHFPPKSMQENGGTPAFYQKEFYSDIEYEVETGEDSLYLNIWTPSEGADEKLPVALWIHGGSFLGGYGSEMEFDGAAFAKRGVILVTINYRVNVFGFLAHPWLNAENEKGISGNYGILDQLAALKWVAENIGAFGGDRDNITIFGQSAGAMGVQALVSSELLGDMASKAIMQSGGGYGKGMHRDLTLQEAMCYGERYVELTGAKNIEQLRAMSAEHLIASLAPMMGEMFAPDGGLFLVPNIDGYVLKQGYYEAIEQNRVKKMPYLLGSNKNDILVTKEDAETGKPGVLYEGCRDFSYKMEELQNNPAYVYYFSRQLPGDTEGAFHSAELWYMFGTLERCWRPMLPEDRMLSEEMLNYWCNFIKTGNPNGMGQKEWRPCRKGDSFVMDFNC